MGRDAPAMTPAGGRSVVVLSNLYPSTAFPGRGPFVRDQVRVLARRNRLAVVSPLKVSPLTLETLRRVRAVPRLSVEEGIPVTRVRFPDFPVAGLTLEPRLWVTRLLPVLRRVYRELGADLVHAHYGFPDGFVASRFAAQDGVPFVVTLWGSDVLQLLGSRRVRGLLRQTFAEARAIIGVSTELAERAEELGARPDRLYVVPGGVPYSHRLDRAGTRAGLGLGDDVRCLLWVGGLVAVKQPLDAIRALTLLRAAGGVEYRLVVIGDGPLRTAAAEMVRRLGLDDAVRLVGHLSRDEVWAWQSAADVLVNSSRSEGTPLAVLESLGAGTPAVGYPLPGVRAALDAVAGGRVAAESTPGALADAIRAELETRRDRDELARAARQRFDIEQVCSAIEDVYAAALG